MDNEVKFEVYRSISKKEQQLCFHTRAEIDEKTRTLECINCGSILDPFNFLMTIALEERSLQMKADMLKNEIKRLSQEYEELSKQVKYVRRKVNRK